MPGVWGKLRVTPGVAGSREGIFVVERRELDLDQNFAGGKIFAGSFFDMASELASVAFVYDDGFERIFRHGFFLWFLSGRGACSGDLESLFLCLFVTPSW